MSEILTMRGFVMFDDKSKLITSVTGSFGHRYVRMLPSRYKPIKVIVSTRGELKQCELQNLPEEAEYDPLW